MFREITKKKTVFTFLQLALKPWKRSIASCLTQIDSGLNWIT